MSSSSNSSSKFEYFRYDPSLAAAIIFVVAFSFTSTFHLYQMISTRTWYLIPLVIGGFFEVVGYAARAVCAQQTPNFTLVPYIIVTIFPLVAPALLAASIYMMLGRIILLVDGESLSIIRRRWLTKIFVSGDVLCFLLQGGGGGIMAGGKASSMTTGSHIIVVGVVTQIAFFGLFMIVAFVFHRRILYHTTPKSQSTAIPWQKHMTTLYVTSMLIMIRSVFRVIEYVQGNDGFISQHEWFLYIFDALLMFAVLVNFNFVHPSEVKALLRGGKWASGVRMHTMHKIESPRSSTASRSPLGQYQRGRETADECV